jgi:hypothetical protein
VFEVVVGGIKDLVHGNLPLICMLEQKLGEKLHAEKALL